MVYDEDVTNTCLKYKFTNETGRFNPFQCFIIQTQCTIVWIDGKDTSHNIFFVRLSW